MRARCDQLSTYLDGELAAADAEAFERHLASCADCHAASHDGLHLAALGAATRLAGRSVVGRRRWRLAVGLAALAAAVLLASWARRPAPRADGAIALLTAPVRGNEARISYAAADRYRPYDVARAGDDRRAHDAIALGTLSELERRGDLHGVAAALLLMNDAPRAGEYLDKAAPSADATADRALIQRATGQLPEALITLDGVLATSPRHAQALWNRALVLRDLGLPLSAAEAYRAVAVLGEPGWADEARRAAQALTDQVAERHAAFDRVLDDDGPRLATDGNAVTPEVARRFPGVTRLRFYDAVRAATTREAVQALAPLAATLDAIYGETTLAGYVERTARADFARRAPLAQAYGQLVAGTLDPAAKQGLLDRLRAAKQDDILLGAIVQLNRLQVPAPLMPEVERIAGALHDPWFHLLAVEHAAGLRVAAGEPTAAESLLLPELAHCTIDYRCTNLDLMLGETYLLTLRLADTRRVVGDGWARAQRGGEWYLQRRLVEMRARLEGVQDDVEGTTLPLVRAYAGEKLLRNPGVCGERAWYHEMLAATLVNRADLVQARAELTAAAGIVATCPVHQPSIAGADVKARALRDPALAPADQIATLQADIAALRGQPGPAGAQAALDLIEGRLLLERDHAAAIQRLERATSAHEDDIARMARSYAYGALTLDAGRAGAWDRVLALLAASEGTVVPPRCALGVAVEELTSVVVVRDAAGALHGGFDPARPGPTIDATTLVPDALRAALHGCAAVDVIARPPVQGLPRLLPLELAWSYRSTSAPTAAPTARPRRVVISDAEPPAALGLPRLLPWQSSTAPDVVLAGPAATPSHVLAELTDASFVEIHAHGMVQANIADASFLMLSPEADGRYALTARAIRSQALHGHPVVILGACHAATTAKYRHEAWGLPAAFLAAGARAVIASTDVISDAEAGAFFDDVRGRIERGGDPAVALRDARTTWLATHHAADWTRSLMVFQ